MSNLTLLLFTQTLTPKLSRQFVNQKISAVAKKYHHTLKLIQTVEVPTQDNSYSQSMYIQSNNFFKVQTQTLLVLLLSSKASRFVLANVDTTLKYDCRFVGTEEVESPIVINYTDCTFRLASHT